MKKNLFLRLCLILLVSLTIYSCRTEHLPENETAYNNSSKFQLTSKRISLNESKHKEKLIIELHKAEDKFKAISKTNINGRVIDYGNGVSINIDNVIYIENGPNYHTYTFNITRENAPADTPVENLVLSPLTDGTYRELLVTYNLTAQEKQMLENRIPVDTKGKVTITELTQGTYNNGGMITESTISCNWVEETVWQPCSEGLHDGTNSNECAFINDFTNGTPPTAYTIMSYKCKVLHAEYGLGDNGEGGGSGPGTSSPGGLGNGEDDGSGNNEFPSNEPGDCDGGLTAPQTPSYDISDGGCGNGIPTQPTFPSLGDDPCRKTRASITAANNVLKNPDVQTKMDAVLRGKTQAPNEWGVAIGEKSNGYEVTNAVEGIPGESEVSIPVSQLTTPLIGDGHSHAGAAGRPSGGDLYEMLKALLTHTDFKFRYVYGNYFGVPENYALIINDRNAALAFLGQFPRSENYDELGHTIRRDSPLGLEFYKAVKHYSEGRSENSSGEDYDANAVAMAYVFDKFSTGINIAKTDLNGDLKKIVTNIQKITIPASGGAVKEGIKVSKCP